MNKSKMASNEISAERMKYVSMAVCSIRRFLNIVNLIMSQSLFLSLSPKQPRTRFENYIVMINDLSLSPNRIIKHTLNDATS